MHEGTTHSNYVVIETEIYNSFTYLLQTFDPHYTPVDIEKPSFCSTPRMSLLSMDIFQSLYVAQTNTTNRKLHTEQLSSSKVLPNVCDVQYDRSDSCVTLRVSDKGYIQEVGQASVKVGNRRVSSTSSELSDPFSSSDSEEINKFSETVGNSPYDSSSLPYIQHPSSESVLNVSSSTRELDCDNQGGLLGRNTDEELSFIVPNHRNDVVLGDDVPCGDFDLQNFADKEPELSSIDSLHCLEHSSTLMQSHPCAALSTDRREKEMENPAVQLDKLYVSSASGYIQSHNPQLAVDKRFSVQDDESNIHLLTNQGENEQQHVQSFAVEHSLESPSCLFATESIMSLDSNLNLCDDVHVTSSEEEVDILGLDEPNLVRHQEHLGYITGEHPITGTMLIPCDSAGMDFDFKHGLVSTTAQRPTSIGLKLVSDYVPSDVSSGYVSTSCASCDQYNPMEVLMQKRLKDVKEDIEVNH